MVVLSCFILFLSLIINMSATRYGGGAWPAARESLVLEVASAAGRGRAEIIQESYRIIFPSIFLIIIDIVPVHPHTDMVLCAQMAVLHLQDTLL